MALTQIVGAVEPIGAEDTHLQLSGSALSVGVQGVEEGGAVVPLQVVKELTQLVLNYVEVSTIGPVVPQVDHLQDSALVHHQYGVELVGPRRRHRVLRRHSQRCRCH